MQEGEESNESESDIEEEESETGTISLPESQDCESEQNAETAVSDEDSRDESTSLEYNANNSEDCISPECKEESSEEGSIRDLENTENREENSSFVCYEESTAGKTESSSPAARDTDSIDDFSIECEAENYVKTISNDDSSEYYEENPDGDEGNTSLHSEDSEDSSNLECDVCRFPADNLLSLMRHLQQHLGIE